MGQILVRRLSEEAIAALKTRAKKNGRSAEAEVRTILEETLSPKKEDVWAEMERLRNELRESGRTFEDSTAFIREDRDTR